MNKKSDKNAALIQNFKGHELDPHYLAYFDCFNRQLYYEAHDVLEELWLTQRRQPDDLFYKGLIQLAGAFVHVQKQRPGPASALLKLARDNLAQFPPVHHRLGLGEVLALIELSLTTLERGGLEALNRLPAPCLKPGTAEAKSEPGLGEAGSGK